MKKTARRQFYVDLIIIEDIYFFVKSAHRMSFVVFVNYLQRKKDHLRKGAEQTARGLIKAPLTESLENVP